MKDLAEIKAAIEELNGGELSGLYQWLTEYVERDWDARMSSDAREGRLDRFKHEIAGAKATGDLIDFPRI